MKSLISEVYNDSVLWQMSRCERASLLNILEGIDLVGNDAAFEIGTYTGGSLQHLKEYFDKVVSVDISRSYLHPSLLGHSNIDFVTGDSTKVGIPKLINEVSKDFDIKFFLIDANHEYDYVKSDINNVLTYVPKSETILLIHDSWYPPSRQAIIDSNLTSCPYVHFVDTDFCSGELANKNLLIGGFCLVLMYPEERKTPLNIKQSQDHFFRLLKDRLD